MDVTGTITVVDDDPEMRDLLQEFFLAEGHQVISFTKPAEAVRFLTCPTPEEQAMSSSCDVVVSDITMPEMNGIELMRLLKKERPELLTILGTAFGSIESAIEAIRDGAFDYVVKPFKLSDLSVTVARAIQFRKLQRENAALRMQMTSSFQFAGMIGKSAAMRRLFDLIQRIAKSSASVLITGESGTGKEMAARAIHNLSPKAARPFVAINCSSIPEGLLESELFGHAKGSFTGALQRKKGLFEEADGGTIFLDEIGDLQLSLQAKLLRVLQERAIRPVGDNETKPIDVRILSATHKDLKAAIKSGTFREDLFYRLSVVPVEMPALRHRIEDIPLLAEHFLRKYAAINSCKATSFSHKAMARIVSQQWQGNVRELENAVERAVILSEGAVIDETEIPAMRPQEFAQFQKRAFDELITLDELKDRYMQFVLEKTKGKKEKAAQILGINRRTLYRREKGQFDDGEGRVGGLDGDEDGTLISY